MKLNTIDSKSRVVSCGPHPNHRRIRFLGIYISCSLKLKLLLTSYTIN